MFSISASSTNGFNIITLSDEINHTAVEIIPGCGALLHSFIVMHNNKPINVIDSYADKKEFEDSFEAKGFKSAKLSPFVCRVKNGEYKYGEKNYRIDKFYLGKNAIHGVIYDKPFKVINSQGGKEKATVELMYEYRGEDAGYPFHYNCTVIYELTKENSLTVSTRIVNRDAGIIPVCDGWHPYFSFGSKIDECQLEFQSKEMVEFDQELIPTGKLIPYQDFGSLKKIGDVFFDNCFTVNFAECQPMLVFRDPELQLQLEIRPATSYPYLQVYTPGHRQSIAFENLSAAPDAFNNGMGLISLPAGEQVSFVSNFVLRAV